MATVRATGALWIGLIVVLGVALLPLPAAAQSKREGSGASQTFGTASQVSHTVPAVLFTPYNFSYPDRYDTTTSGSRFCIGLDCVLVAAVQLPAGALVTSIEVDGCDSNAASNFSVTFNRGTFNAGVTTTLATATSSGSSGCDFITATLATPETIDNWNNNYFLEFFSITPGSTLQF